MTPARWSPWLKTALCVGVVLGCAGGCRRRSSSQQAAATASPVASSEPGPEPDAVLRRRLLEALDAKGPDYVPRTKHRTADGGPKYTNRLLLESSPYLLQHAHNPVNWFSWGPEALALAKALGRPIFLSVGYSTCHWCHVMEEESFEDEEIARVLNERYIPIKVDREQRPDIDSSYMTAVNLMTGRGGWPMSVWLTSDLEPYFGGTYFPARAGDRGTRVGFLQLLVRNADEYQREPAAVASRAQELVRAVKQELQPAGAGGSVGASVLQAAERAARSSYDRQHGGRRGAPKFPSSFPLRFLLRRALAERTTPTDAQPTAGAMVRHTLQQMAQGGIYDHVGGGFHRYSTDARWLVPHFEKMLYDNALLSMAYLEGHEVFPAAGFDRIAGETLDYAVREMQSTQGGFFSATDADSLGPTGEREEGYYFSWTPSELQVLGEPHAAEWTALYNVTARGNFEGRSILHLSGPLAEAKGARAAGGARRFWEEHTSARAKLQQVRGARPAPLLDDKLQAGWNGLMIAALARGARVLDKPAYLDAARRAADDVLARLRKPGGLRHSALGAEVSGRAFLEDYAFLASGLIELFETTYEAQYLATASALMDELARDFSDPVNGGYFLTAATEVPPLVREKPERDGAIPNGNSWALLSELRLYQWTQEPRWMTRSETTLRAFAKKLERSPLALSDMLVAVEYALARPLQIVIVVPDAPKGAPAGPKSAFELRRNPLSRVLAEHFLPYAVQVVITESDVEALKPMVPWLKGKGTRGGPTAYVCEEGACQLPTSDPQRLRSQLRALRGVSAP